MGLLFPPECEAHKNLLMPTRGRSAKALSFRPERVARKSPIIPTGARSAQKPCHSDQSAQWRNLTWLGHLLGRFLDCARNDSHYSYSDRSGANEACCHFDRAKRVESTVISTERSEWRNLNARWRSKGDLSIAVASSLQSG